MSESRGRSAGRSRGNMLAPPVGLLSADSADGRRWVLESGPESESFDLQKHHARDHKSHSHRCKSNERSVSISFHSSRSIGKPARL